MVTRKIGQKGGNSHTVRINESMCSCGKWQIYQIPCSHVIAYCAYLNLGHERFVGDCYKLENVAKVYNGIFEPILSKGDARWLRLVDFPKVTHGFQRRREDKSPQDLRMQWIFKQLAERIELFD